MRSPFASTRVQPRRRAVRRAAAAVAAAMAALAAAFACMSALLPLLAMSGLPRAEAAVAEISPTVRPTLPGHWRCGTVDGRTAACQQ